jgi:hypothetical protein
VLVEYLIPMQSTATSQGEHVFFDIDVKGGEKEWSRCYNWRSKHQPFRVSINAKGGDCWHVSRESVFFSLMERTTTSMLYKKNIISGGAKNSMQKQESSKAIVVSRIVDEVQKMDLQEEQRSRPVNT